jgi:hypothetical protein
VGGEGVLVGHSFGDGGVTPVLVARGRGISLVVSGVGAISGAGACGLISSGVTSARNSRCWGIDGVLVRYVVASGLLLVM